jgi:hypothetical protein
MSVQICDYERDIIIYFSTIIIIIRDSKCKDEMFFLPPIYVSISHSCMPSFKARSSPAISTPTMRHKRALKARGVKAKAKLGIYAVSLCALLNAIVTMSRFVRKDAKERASVNEIRDMCRCEGVRNSRQSFWRS